MNQFQEFETLSTIVKEGSIIGLLGNIVTQGTDRT